MSIKKGDIDIANGLKNLRLKHNYTQEYVAEVLGKGDYSAYYRIESARSDLKFADAFKLAALYNVSMEEIYDPTLLGQMSVKSDKRQEINSASKITVSVVLDGHPATLKNQVDLITKINELLGS